MSRFRNYAPLAFAILSLALAGYQFASAFSSGAWKNPSDEMVSKWDDRVQSLREALPPGLKRAGYVDDAALNGEASSFDANEFQLMQYSLAPVALQMGVEYEWIVGNFRDEENLQPWLDEQFGKYEVQGFGFGLYLIHDVED